MVTRAADTVRTARRLAAVRPVALGAIRLARWPVARQAVRSLVALDSRPGQRHPLAPAALRVERSRVRHASGSADQTALTVWFGSGPSLPAPGLGGRASRAVLRAAAAALGAAALGALAAIAAQREVARVDAPPAVPRLES